MINSMEKAVAVQERRFNARKNGMAKAVRRYVLRNHSSKYKEIISGFKTRWPSKK